MSDGNKSDSLKLDALYTIFEKHLYDFEEDEETEKGFIDNIVNDYLRFLTTSGVVVPRRWQSHVIDELRDQVRKMLVKKMYGCLSVSEFLVGQKDRKEKKRVAKRKYSKIF
jgi:hypothetical protein